MKSKVIAMLIKRLRFTLSVLVLVSTLPLLSIVTGFSFNTPSGINNRPIAGITLTPGSNITSSTPLNWSYTSSIDIDGDAIINAEWQLDNGGILYEPVKKVTTPGMHVMRLRVQDSRGAWSDWTMKVFYVVN